ncbi:hypothetical protein GOODEAATRI_034265 [Goodea atripinnis]|uniref:Uncharacterized protein n=1 Tax=Goodea atripinnis TaxID=208336 RepID=A0ABV0NQE9_9TELE
MFGGTLLCLFPQFLLEQTKRGWKRLNVRRTQTFNCKRCRSQHAPKLSPAYGKICKRCKGQNHFAKQCFSKMQQNEDKSVHAVEETPLSDTFFECRNTRRFKAK